MSQEVVLIDYGAGNVRSVGFALERIGYKAVLSRDVEVLERAERLIFPGVGHAAAAMAALQDLNINSWLPNFKKPFLGICLGMQLLLDESEEGNTKGLGIFSGKVQKFPPKDRVPHMGWNEVEGNGPLYKGLNKAHFYFVHSYYAELNTFTSGICEYILPFSASLEKDNFFACQFHPERSGKNGETLLKNFLSL
ncbi:MAG: imidazole glycerol phosphate synthase subunit HisH [Cytophagales bacterium]|nr:MAG: imidazole glycerol phosphate synthase subunit HisH [Cytophagales bacterium]TAF60051.1 MAG: imidazole glycerol phosphate synthase subunit HisH [Cytophagales bacterium]